MLIGMRRKMNGHPQHASARTLSRRARGRRSLMMDSASSNASRFELVVRPASLSAVGDDSRVLENFEMKREPRLCGVEIGHEIADAALAAFERRDYLEPRLIGECVEQLDSGGEIGGGRWHRDLNISMLFDSSRDGHPGSSGVVLGALRSAEDERHRKTHQQSSGDSIHCSNDGWTAQPRDDGLRQ